MTSDTNSLDTAFAFSRRSILLGGAALLALAAANRPLTALAATKSMKIGIIGSGRIGGKLAEYWADAGHQVMVSSQNLDEMKALAAKIGHGAKAGTAKEAAAFGEVVLVSVPFKALPQVGMDYAAELKGKVVLDTCNPSERRDGDMAKEAIEKGTGVVDPTFLPGTRLVRAFNTVNFMGLSTEAHRSGELVGVPLASNDKGAMDIAAQLVRDAGFEPVIVGDLSTAKSFDPGTPIYGKALPASEVRMALGVK
jgi:hypothetical protein